MGLRIREALGTEKRDFRARKDGSRYLRLRAQATVDGKGREPLKHRKEGQGRDIPVPDFARNMVQGMPDGPLCPGPNSTRYMPYYTARGRLDALTSAMGAPATPLTACGTSSPPRTWTTGPTSRTSRPSWDTARWRPRFACTCTRPRTPRLA